MTKAKFDKLYQKLPLKGRRTMICEETGLTFFQVNSVLSGYTTDQEKVELVCNAVQVLAERVTKDKKRLPSFRSKSKAA